MSRRVCPMRLATVAALAAVLVTACTGGSTDGAGTVSNAAPSRPAKMPPGGRFYVDGRFLRDACGDKVVLRGVSEMVVWSGDRTGHDVLAEIAKTGANAVRIVWTTTEGTIAEMDAAIARAIALGLVPVLELHDATGDFDKLETLLSFWLRPEVLAVVKMHEASLVLNIGNEVGDDKVPLERFRSAYTDAIRRLRDAGVRVPLMIDSTTWGQDLDRLLAAGPDLIASDPQTDILLSVHAWWIDGSAHAISEKLDRAAASGLPIVVGEFGPHAVYECSAHPFDVRTFLAKAAEHEIGFLAWSWGGVKNRDCDGAFDMTEGGSYEHLTGWGEVVARTDPSSIEKTSRRVAHLGKSCAAR